MEKIIDFIIKYKAVVIGIVVILFVAMFASLGVMIYGNTLRIDDTEIAGVFGMNGKNQTKIVFDDATTDAVLAAIKGMVYDGADKGKSSNYETYVCIEMTDGTKYSIKYCDAQSVYISGGNARTGKYVNKRDEKAMSDIIAITTALESKNGSGADKTSSTASGSTQSAASSAASSAVNSVEQ